MSRTEHVTVSAELAQALRIYVRRTVLALRRPAVGISPSDVRTRVLKSLRGAICGDADPFDANAPELSGPGITYAFRALLRDHGGIVSPAMAEALNALVTAELLDVLG